MADAEELDRMIQKTPEETRQVEDWLDDHHEALQVALERLEVSIGRFLDLIEDRMATKVKKLQPQAQETRESLKGW